MAAPLLAVVTLLSWLQTKMKGELLVTTKYKSVLEILSGKVTNTGNTAAMKPSLSLRKRGVLFFQLAELGNSIAYTAEGTTCISSISLQGKF